MLRCGQITTVSIYLYYPDYFWPEYFFDPCRINISWPLSLERGAANTATNPRSTCHWHKFSRFKRESGEISCSSSDSRSLKKDHTSVIESSKEASDQSNDGKGRPGCPNVTGSLCNPPIKWSTPRSKVCLHCWVLQVILVKLFQQIIGLNLSHNSSSDAIMPTLPIPHRDPDEVGATKCWSMLECCLCSWRCWDRNPPPKESRLLFGGCMRLWIVQLPCPAPPILIVSSFQTSQVVDKLQHTFACLAIRMEVIYINRPAIRAAKAKWWLISFISPWDLDYWTLNARLCQTYISENQVILWLAVWTQSIWGFGPSLSNLSNMVSMVAQCGTNTKKIKEDQRSTGMKRHNFATRMLSKWVAECCIEFVGTLVILFPAWQRGSWSASSDPWICHGWCFSNKNRFTSATKAPATIQKRYVSFRQHVLQEKFVIMLRRLYRTLAKNACPGCSTAKRFATRQFHSTATRERRCSRHIHAKSAHPTNLSWRLIPKLAKDECSAAVTSNYDPWLSILTQKANPHNKNTRQESAKTVKPT